MLSDGDCAGLGGGCSVAEVGGAFPAGVSPVVVGCGGKGGVCAQAPALSDETRKDVDKSNLDRNAIHAPLDQRGYKRNADTPISSSDLNSILATFASAPDPHAELLVNSLILLRQV